jgi:hypothetical protein
MHLKKRFHLLSLAVVAAAMVAVPSAASADTGACVFQGLAGNINPGVMLVGGTGAYEFSTPTTSPRNQATLCSYNNSAPAVSKIVSKGTFVNMICGTGTADGTEAETKIDQGADGTNEISSAAYHIDFRGTQGTLDISRVNGRTETLGPVNGHVSITPTVGSCTTGVTGFEVAGALAAQW